MTRQFWVTLIIIIIWIGTLLSIFFGQLDLFLSLLICFALTFYLIIFGLQRAKE